MKKTTLQHRTLKLNKGRIADLQSGTILGGRDRAGQNKVTNLCANTDHCTVSGTIYTTSYIACPAPGTTIITH
jgi:hypothetical protein